MSKTWNIKIDNYFQANLNCIIATAHVDSFPTDLPLELNIREANRKSATYKQIIDSLTTEPVKFFSRHSKIVLSANKAKPVKNKTELELKILDSNKQTKHPVGMSLPSNITDTRRERLTAFLLSQALWIEQRLYEIIQEHISNPRKKGANDLASIDIRKTTLFPDSKYSFGFGAPTNLALPIIASYRVFSDKDYKWILAFNKFAEDFLQHLWTNYFHEDLVLYKTLKNIVGTKISRNQEIWESLYISAQSYLNQHLIQMVNFGKEEPEAKVTQGRKGRWSRRNIAYQFNYILFIM